MKPANPSPISRRLLQFSREQGHYTQLSAAKFLGMTQARVSRQKTGSLQSIGIAKVLKIVRRTGCDLQWLLTGKHSAPTPRCITKLNKLMGYTKRAG